MKLAEALHERANLQVRIQELNNRLMINAQVQEGETPAEDPEKLFAELEGCLNQLEELIRRINRTNCETVVDGKSLTDLLARRDCLSQRVSLYQRFLNTASVKTSRSTKSELRTLSTVSVPEYRKKADRYAAELRTIDVTIQAANWTTDLL